VAFSPGRGSSVGLHRAHPIEQLTATCPNCGDYLSEGHRCSGKELRVMRMLSTALLGALFGVVTVSVLVEQPTALLLAVIGILGASLVTAVRRVTGF
jgi:hypothetical protein